MLIAQVTDLHLGFAPGGDDEPNARRFAAVVARLRAMTPAPDMLFLTGDLAEHGDRTAYERVKAMIAALPFPVHLMVGNHDNRVALATVFPETPRDENGFVTYAVDAGDLGCLVLDTLEAGRHAGAFCERRAAGLARLLAEEPDRPTLVLLHHPPVASGIEWIDPDPREPWIGRLAGTLAGHRHLVGLVAGHVHRPATTVWQGLPVTIAPSCAPELALELAPIDPERPDGRPLIVDGPIGFALHRWDGERLFSHFGWVDGDVIARFDGDLQPMIRSAFAERPGDL